MNMCHIRIFSCLLSCCVALAWILEKSHFQHPLTPIIKLGVITSLHSPRTVRGRVSSAGRVSIMPLHVTGISVPRFYCHTWKQTNRACRISERRVVDRCLRNLVLPKLEHTRSWSKTRTWVPMHYALLKHKQISNISAARYIPSIQRSPSQQFSNLPALVKPLWKRDFRHFPLPHFDEIVGKYNERSISVPAR